MAITHANDTTIDTIIGDGITLVDFWASWCGPCRMFGPIFESVSDTVPDVKFVKFEIDETNRRTPAKYGIRSIPSVLAFKNGELVEARTGLMDEETVLNWIQELNNGKQYEFYSPVKQNLTHINMVRKTIQMQVPMYSIIVFIKGNINNVNSNKVYRLKSFIENIKHYEKIKISVETVEEIYTILKDYKDNPRATIKEHINNINKF